MKAIQAQSLSGPEGLVYTDVETPGAGPNVVVVDVKAAGVCFPDYLMTKGEYQLKMEPPFVPGIETAGVVRSAPEGSGIKPGDRVMAFNFIGGYAERVAVAPSNILPTPPQLDDAEAVALIANYHTMYFAYARRGQLRAGETVLVLGAAGGIGTAAIQIAKGTVGINNSKVLGVIPILAQWNHNLRFVNGLDIAHHSVAKISPRTTTMCRSRRSGVMLLLSSGPAFSVTSEDGGPERFGREGITWVTQHAVVLPWGIRCVRS